MILPVAGSVLDKPFTQSATSPGSFGKKLPVECALAFLIRSLEVVQKSGYRTDHSVEHSYISLMRGIPIEAYRGERGIWPDHWMVKYHTASRI